MPILSTRLEVVFRLEALARELKTGPSHAQARDARPALFAQLQVTSAMHVVRCIYRLCSCISPVQALLAH